MSRQSFRYIAKVRESLIKNGQESLARKFNGGNVYSIYYDKQSGKYIHEDITELLMNGNQFNKANGRYRLAIGTDECNSILDEMNTYIA